MLGDDIRKLRDLMKLTQEQFANKIGVSFATVNRWENEHFRPTPLAMAVLKRLANQIGFELKE